MKQHSVVTQKKQTSVVKTDAQSKEHTERHVALQKKSMPGGMLLCRRTCRSACCSAEEHANKQAYCLKCLRNHVRYFRPVDTAVIACSFHSSRASPCVWLAAHPGHQTVKIGPLHKAIVNISSCHSALLHSSCRRVAGRVQQRACGWRFHTWGGLSMCVCAERERGIAISWPPVH